MGMLLLRTFLHSLLLISWIKTLSYSSTYSPHILISNGAAATPLPGTRSGTRKYKVSSGFENLPKATNDAQLDTMVKEAILLYHASELKPAMVACQTVLQLDGQHPECLYLTGLILYAIDNIPEAVQFLLDAAKVSPERGEVWSHYGVALRHSRGSTGEETTTVKFEFTHLLDGYCISSCRTMVVSPCAITNLQFWPSIIVSYHAIVLEPNNKSFWYNYALALTDAKEYECANNANFHLIELYKLASTQTSLDNFQVSVPHIVIEMWIRNVQDQYISIGNSPRSNTSCLHCTTSVVQPTDGNVFSKIQIVLNYLKSELLSPNPFTLHTHFSIFHRSHLLMQLAIVFHQMELLETAQVIYEYVLLSIQNGNMEPIETPLEAADRSTQQIQNKNMNHMKRTILSNLGAIHQARGSFSEAVSYYNEALLHTDENTPSGERSGVGGAGIYNNIGACLWHSGHQEQALISYKKALQLAPNSIETLINLGTSAAEYGDIAHAKVHLQQALRGDPSMTGVRIRIATLIHPIMQSSTQIATDRQSFIRNIETITSLLLSEQYINSEDTIPREPKLSTIRNPVNDVEKLHFYYVYHGFDELHNQIRIRKLMRLASPVLQYSIPYPTLDFKSDEQPSVPDNKVPLKARVGFISKFWHTGHPHSQLLEGVLSGLSNTGKYDILVIALPHPVGGPSEVIYEAVGHNNVVHLASSLIETRRAVENLSLDMLIYVDTMSEPTTNYLSYSRLAPIQAAFWGNPLTTGGSEVIDYFISGELLEPSTTGNSHYSEQLVRFSGLGILYSSPSIPFDIDPAQQFGHPRCNLDVEVDSTQYCALLDNMNRVKNKALRNTFGAPYWWEGNSKEETTEECACIKDMHRRSSVVYMIPQSLFKIHPGFDGILHSILSQVPRSHIVLLQGRQRTWTDALKSRFRNHSSLLSHALMGSATSGKRIHFTPRTLPGDQFLQLLAGADIILHPFPFGGSKTSMDAISLGIPMVAMEGQFLRGRMAYAFYTTMGCGLDGKPPFTGSITDYCSACFPGCNEGNDCLKHSNIIFSNSSYTSTNQMVAHNASTCGCDVTIVLKLYTYVGYNKITVVNLPD